MLDSFDQKKAQILAEIATTNEANPDLSPKGTIDELCLPIMNSINSHRDMITTSSCSGRVSVFLEGDKKGSSKIGAKGVGGHWLFVTHDKKQVPHWWKNIDFENHVENSNFKPSRFVLFKFEPLILHVKCRDLTTSQKLYQTAMSCGFRESGIGVNNIVGIRISIKLDIPIGYLNEEGKCVLLVNENYLEFIDNQAINRFNENEFKLNLLHRKISDIMFAGQELTTEETKNERRDRKRREGLAKKEALMKEREKKLGMVKDAEAEHS
ncbi:BA75_00977T0 [Komagataella pastoris]|uniref:tRNA wybutosine-synthesizing protein 3 n=1 Tax=Komagataella pastoris TaxID=4922 RepID=A0A1B2J9P9_PICPA|nr:BA75_00977T0 [Komagataella pastoris]